MEKVMGMDWPGPISPIRSKSFDLDPVRLEMDILDVDVDVCCFYRPVRTFGGQLPGLSLIEALDAVFLMVIVMVPRLSGISTDGVTLYSVIVTVGVSAWQQR